MKKKFIYLLLLIVSFGIGLTDVFASSAKISSNSLTITKGNSVNVTVTVNTDSPMVSIEGKLTCTGVIDKTYDLNYDDSSNSLKTKTYTYTLTPSKSGTFTCSLVNTRVTHMGSSSWENLAANKLVVTVNEPPAVVAKPKSSNNFLSSLTVEGLTLEETFDKEKLEYTVNVPAETEKIKINAQLADSSAKVTGVGEISVSSGLNTFEIVVTAENGSKRTYVLKATVLELEPIEVKISNETYTVVRKRKDLPKISEYFEEKDIIIGENTVEGYYSEKLGYSLVGLKDTKGNIEYYIYKNNKYTLYKEYTFGATTLQILDKELDNEYKKSSFTYDSDKIIGYQTIKVDILKNTYALDSDDITGNQFYLFYAKNVETGKEYLYQYDTLEKTVQRYNLEVLDMYKENSNTYYMYLLGSILIIGFLIIILSITLISKHKKQYLKEETKPKKRKKKKLDKNTMDFDEDEE